MLATSSTVKDFSSCVETSLARFVMLSLLSWFRMSSEMAFAVEVCRDMVIKYLLVGRF